MGFEKAGDILRSAYRDKRAVAAFNVFNYETIQWAALASEALQLPVLVGFYPGWQDFITLKTIYEITKSCAQDLKAPICLHLDHCNELDGIKRALDAGFASVMFDGSQLPFEENLEKTRQAVEIAASYGADVEGELGHVGDASQLLDTTDRSHFTDVKKALRFVKESGVSSLAISIGNAHGPYVRTPSLDITLLSEINAITNIPLVLHGGSGIPHDQVQKAVQNGISKMNVGTDFFRAYFRSLQKVMKKEDLGEHMYNTTLQAAAEVVDFLKEKIQMLHG
ncbi:class II fructose-1,6-bisphosphate aldolase [Treponema sp.]